MPWVALFEDNPDAGDIRRQYLQDHMDYLHGRSEVIAAGGLRQTADLSAFPCGGMWLLTVASREEAVALCENDPFFINGLRARYHLYFWNKAYPEGPTTI